MNPQPLPSGGPILLDRLPLTILLEIFCQLKDYKQIKFLARTNKVLYVVYKWNRRKIMIRFVQNAYSRVGLDLNIPLLACKSRMIRVTQSNHLQCVEKLLRDNSERQPLSEEQFLSITMREGQLMFFLLKDAMLICKDMHKRMLRLCPVHTGANRKPLSHQEHCNIITAICRWELWTGLFAKRGPCSDNVLQSKRAQIREDDQKRLYLGRYSHWEQQQLGCLWFYASRKYDKIIKGQHPWFAEASAKPFEPYTIRDSIVSQGPSLLAKVLRQPCRDEWAPWMTRPRETFKNSHTDIVLPFVSGFQPYMRAIVDHFAYPAPDQSAPPADDSNASDAPYGFLWAREDLRDPSFPTLRSARPHLWYWGYTFWSEERLRSWGIEIDGSFVYCDSDHDGIYEEGVSFRQSGEVIEPVVNDIEMD